MGGGDLNMKKHFHPLTMQNLERVWKAEQKAKDEAEKLQQLQRELEEERRREALQQHAVEQGIAKKKSEKLSWMYAGPQVNHEEYLLGRKIDKNVEILKDASENKEQTPGASFTADTIADPAKDMAAKIKEDPLFLIKKKEEDSKKELVQNPIKLKKLKEMLNLSVSDKRKHKKQKKDKKAKRKKERKRERSQPNGYNDSREKYRNHEREAPRGRHEEQRTHKSRRHRSSYSDSDLSENEHLKKHRPKHEKMNGERIRKYSSSDEDKSRSRRKDPMRRAIRGRSPEDNRMKSDYHTSTYNKEKQREKQNEASENIHINDRSDKSHYSFTGSRKYGLSHTKAQNEKPEKDRRKNRRDSSRESNDNSRSQQQISKDSRLRKRHHHHHDASIDSQSDSHSDSPNNKKSKYSKNGSKLHDRKPRPKARSATSSSEEEDDRSPILEKKQERSRKACSGSDSESHRSRNAKKVTTHRNGDRPPRMLANNISRKLNADELEKRRQEMMANAKWRDDQRGKNVKQYKLEDEMEEDVVKKQLKSYDRESKAKFIHEMQVKSYSSTSTASVEDRIKRNIYTKQRTQAALNKKFTEK